jgi:hypothetical protein
MKNQGMTTAEKKEKVFPGHLFIQFIVRDRDSKENRALLSVLDRECYETALSSVNDKNTDFSDYISEMSVYQEDYFLEILKGLNGILIDIFNIEFVPLLHTLIPFKEREVGIAGTLSDNDDESEILWSLTEIK